MPKVIEVDEAEYNQMVALRGVAAKIVAKPESRRLLEQAQKLVDPNASTPLLDEEARNMAPVRELEKTVNERIAKFEKEQEDAKREQTLAAIARRQEDGFAALRREGFLDEGIEKVKKLMEDKGLLDPKDAAAIFLRDNPPQMPSTPSGGMTGTAWNFADTAAESDKDIQALIGSKGDGPIADAAVMRLASSALNDFRSRR
jgi:hypothetical protein